MSLFKKMFHPLYIAGSQNLPKNSFQKKICLSVNALSICIALIGCAVSVFIYFMTHNPGLVALMVTAVLLTPLPIYLNYRGRYNEAALDLYLILPATAFFFSCLIGNMAALDLMIVVLVGSARIMFVHRRLQILGYVIAVLILVVVQMSPSVQLISPIPAGGRGQALVFWSMYLAVILLVIAIFDWYGYINDNIRESAEQESKDKDRFVAKATHEIKVSFRSVFTIIEVLYKTERKQDFGGFKDAVDDLRTACKNTSSIIDNIFEYERYKAGGKPKLRNQLVNIRETLQSIADIYSHSAHEKNVTVELDVSDLIPYHIV